MFRVMLVSPGEGRGSEQDADAEGHACDVPRRVSHPYSAGPGTAKEVRTAKMYHAPWAHSCGSTGSFRARAHRSSCTRYKGSFRTNRSRMTKSVWVRPPSRTMTSPAVRASAWRSAALSTSRSRGATSGEPDRRDGRRTPHGHGAPAPQRIMSSSCSTNVTSWDRGTNDSPAWGSNDGTGSAPAGTEW